MPLFRRLRSSHNSALESASIGIMKNAITEKRTSNPRSPWNRAARQLSANKLAMIALIFLIFMAIVSVAAPLVAPHDPDAINLLEGRLLPPFFMDGGSLKHIFGTDSTGRDVFSRIIYGARISLFVGIVPVVLALLIGVPTGLISGYLGGKVGNVLLRINDVLLAFPVILLALIVISVLGTGILNCMLAVGLANVPSFVLIVRSAVISERNKDYVASAVAQGATTSRIIFRHILPNITSSLVVVATLTFASALLEAAALSFLGLGVQPPTAEWGSMLTEGKNYFYDGWWMLICPGLAIFFVVMSLNIIGDTLRDAFDPRSSKG